MLKKVLKYALIVILTGLVVSGVWYAHTKENAKKSVAKETTEISTVYDSGWKITGQDDEGVDLMRRIGNVEYYSYATYDEYINS